MNYSELTDFEINKLVADRLGLEYKCLHDVLMTKQGRNIDAAFIEADYCNNPSDIMPIAIEHGISLINISGTTMWLAGNRARFETICMTPTGDDNGIQAFDIEDSVHSTKPYRAICECFLMMEVAK